MGASLLRAGTAATVLAVGLLGRAEAQPQPATQASGASAADITELTPEQLANLEVTSVSKKPEKRWRTAAAVYVITRDEIRRSGVTTLVDALRLAPGVQVARINSNQWAVGIRGFGSRLARSLLVLIDGRSVYTPLFAGTYWEVQDVLLEDVERIEVIRGPGGTLWGANAVNGVINIITRSSRDTQGAFATVGGGTEEQGFLGLRYGGGSGDRFSYRVYGKAFDRGAEFHRSSGGFDGWHMLQGGFRTDWERGPSDSLSLQGDLYRGKAGQRTSITSLAPPFLSVVESDSDLSGADLVGRWLHVSSGGAEWSVGAYYDRTDRQDPNFSEVRNTVDLDVQRRASYGRHDLTVGLGYRVSAGTAEAVPTIAFLPPRRTDQLWTGFVGGDLSLVDNVLLATPGLKFERNDYSGFEVQPTLRLIWTPSGRHALWASTSRAVRTPSRVEHDLSVLSLIEPRTPTFTRILGSREFRSEKTLTAQLGYRTRPDPSLTLYATVFYNDHDDLLSLEPGTPFREDSPPPAKLVLPVRIANGIQGSSYGSELSADWSPLSGWRLAGSYSHLRLKLRRSPDSLDASTAASTNGAAPPPHRLAAVAPGHLGQGELRRDGSPGEPFAGAEDLGLPGPRRAALLAPHRAAGGRAGGAEPGEPTARRVRQRSSRDRDPSRPLRGHHVAPLGRRAASWALAVAAAASLAHAPASGAGLTDSQVKAAFLYSFGRFTQWPPASESTRADAFVIAILGDDPFGNILDDMLRGKSIGDSTVVVNRIARAEDLDGAHILYISESEADQLPRILKRVEGSPVLTVGEMSRFAERGGMIRMKTEASRVRLEINVMATERAGLKLSSELLKLARIVGAPQGG